MRCCRLCAKGKKKPAEFIVSAYENLTRQDDVECCPEHAPILAMNLMKEVPTVAIRRIINCT